MTEEEFEREWKTQLDWTNGLYRLGMLSYEECNKIMVQLCKIYRQFYGR